MYIFFDQVRVVCNWKCQPKILQFWKKGKLSLISNFDLSLSRFRVKASSRAASQVILLTASKQSRLSTSQAGDCQLQGCHPDAWQLDIQTASQPVAYKLNSQPDIQSLDRQPGSCKLYIPTSQPASQQFSWQTASQPCSCKLYIQPAIQLLDSQPARCLPATQTFVVSHLWSELVLYPARGQHRIQ